MPPDQIDYFVRYDGAYLEGNESEFGELSFQRTPFIRPRYDSGGIQIGAEQRLSSQFANDLPHCLAIPSRQEPCSDQNVVVNI
jgi:hypothetical protein